MNLRTFRAGMTTVAAVLLAIIGTFTNLPAQAAGGLPGNLPGTTGAQSGGQDEFLKVDDAFRFDAIVEAPDRIKLIWEIAPGYYLYRDRIKVKSASPAVQIGALTLPQGEAHTDDYFGTQQVYHLELQGSLAVPRAAGAAAITLPLSVTYQGCADAGLCYPPETKTLELLLPENNNSGAASGSGSGFVSEQDRLANLIRSGSLPLVLVTFFGLGLLLAFTPCVLPMVPILSGIIAGQGNNVTAARGFALALTYVLGMAVMYTAAGLIAVSAGFNLTAAFQKPWIVILFALLFVALALSMFGLFTIQMPSAIQTRLSDVSNRQRTGTFAGVAVMGALSALIVTACVAPPLIATLIVISQTGNMWRGGAALFVMALGMGAPLLVVGASAGRLLPRAGAWMDTVKNLFGVLMLGVAVWMLARLVPDRVALLLWAVPALIAAWLLIRTALRGPIAKVIVRATGALAAAYGLALLGGAAMGGTDPLSPFATLSSRAATETARLPFKRIKSVGDLDREIAAAAVAGRGAMLDFYADWCVSCKEMERYSFSDPAVRQALANIVLLQADVTANDDTDRALMQRFDIPGPPTIAFYGRDGGERKNFRVVGYMKPAVFAPHVAAALAP